MAATSRRLYAFILNIKQCLADGVAGDFAEVGVWRGNSAATLAHFVARHDRHLYLFDTFTGFDARDFRDIRRTSPGAVPGDVARRGAAGRGATRRVRRTCKDIFRSR